MRFKVPSESNKISSLFASVKSNEVNLHLQDYGISQTTLEQVFNMHAAREEAKKEGTDDKYIIDKETRLHASNVTSLLLFILPLQWKNTLCGRNVDAISSSIVYILLENLIIFLGILVTICRMPLKQAIA